jgi:hypothetical protein
MTTDPIIKRMQDSGIPVTREEYLYIAYMGNPPAELSAEERLSCRKSCYSGTLTSGKTMREAEASLPCLVVRLRRANDRKAYMRKYMPARNRKR